MKTGPDDVSSCACTRFHLAVRSRLVGSARILESYRKHTLRSIFGWHPNALNHLLTWARFWSCWFFSVSRVMPIRGGSDHPSEVEVGFQPSSGDRSPDRER